MITLSKTMLAAILTALFAISGIASYFTVRYVAMREEIAILRAAQQRQIDEDEAIRRAIGTYVEPSPAKGY